MWILILSHKSLWSACYYDHTKTNRTKMHNLCRRNHLPHIHSHICSHNFRWYSSNQHSHCSYWPHFSHTHWYLNKNKIQPIMLNNSQGKCVTENPTSIQIRIFKLCLTCTVDSVPLKSIIAVTHKATNCVDTGGIHMTVVIFQLTLINIFQKSVSN